MPDIKRPRRIISLVPSQTELLFYLGLREEIAGITKFCIHPADLCRNTPKIGGTKNFRFEKIDRLQPDLIIGNKEENYQEGIEKLQRNYNVWISDIYTLQDALSMIQTVGKLTGKAPEANMLSQKIEHAFEKSKPDNSKKVAYFIWQNPYMAAGGQTFIHDMLIKCGFINVFADLPRYPKITAEMLAQARPEYVFLSSEPYPFKEKHIREFRKMCPDARIMLVNGEMFSWYGNRLLLAVPYLQRLLKLLTP